MTDYTPILSLPEVAPNQDQKEATINTALAILEAAMNDTLVVSLAAGNVTLNTDQFTKYFHHQFISATGARIVTIPDTPRWFAVENLGAYSITFKAAGAGSSAMIAELPAGKVGLVISDGADVRFVVPDPTGGVGNLEDLSNVSGTPTDGQVLQWVQSAGQWQPWTLTLAFLGLSDTPNNYSGAAGKIVAVKSDGTGLEFIESSANVTKFTDLTDTPANYTGAANRTVKVNSGGTALIFAQPKLTEATDFPTTYSGASSQFLRVNLASTAVEFDTISFSDLVDGPGEPSTGDYGKFLKVGPTGEIIYSTGTGGPDHFTQLLDTPTSYVGQAKKHTRVNATEDGLEFHSTAFIDLADTPNALTGQDGKFVYVDEDNDTLAFGYPKIGDIADGPGAPSIPKRVIRVNSTSDGLEYAFMSILDLTGFPNSFTGQGGKFLQVKGDESGVQFSSASYTTNFLALTDTPTSYTGKANQFVRVNSGETGLTFSTVTIPVNLTDLADVETGTGTPGDGYVLTYKSGVWQPEPPSATGATSLSELTDVEVGTGTPPEGYVLTRKDGVWQPEPPAPSGAIDFTDLTDVPSSYTGEALKALRVNATEDGLEFFVPAGSTLASLDDVEISSGSPEDGNVLSYLGGSWSPRFFQEAGVYRGEYEFDVVAGSTVFDAGFEPGWTDANQAGWTIVSTTTPFSGYALKSRPIGEDEYTSFTIDIYADNGFGIADVNGSFKVSSAATGYFKIIVDGVEVFSQSGNTGTWDSYTTGSLPDGHHRVEFRYEKTDAAVAGDDCVYIAYASYATIGTYYKKGDIVDYFGARVMSLVDYPTVDPNDTAQWQGFGSPTLTGLADVDMSGLPPIFPIGARYLLSFNGSIFTPYLAADYRAGWGMGKTSIQELDFEDGTIPVELEEADLSGWTVVDDADVINSRDKALQSPNIGNDDFTEFDVTVAAPDDGDTWAFGFSYRTSSESGADYFKVLVDGVEEFSASGLMTDYDYEEINVSAGSHTVTFRYEKNSSTSAGDDCVYINYTMLPTITGQYVFGDVVDYLTKRYICLEPNATSDPSDTESWQVFGDTGGGGGATSLGELSDVDLSTGTPSDGNLLTYRDGIWNAEPPAAFIALPDTPDDYTGQGKKAVVVKDDESGLEFVDRTADFATFISGQPGDSEMVSRFVVATGFTVLSSGHQGSAEVNATSTSTFTFKRNGVNFGTATINAGNNLASFTVTQTTFDPGDILAVVAPSSADTTLADISLTLRANR